MRAIPPTHAFIAAIVAFSAAIAIAIAHPATAGATWSIVAADPQAGEVGVAVASCVPAGVSIVIALAPRQGAAAAAQAQVDEGLRDALLERLLLGDSPDEAVRYMTAPARDRRTGDRQYGVVGPGGESAGFTGDAARAWAGHFASDNLAVQGNLLAGRDVARDASRAFDGSLGAPLADRLMRALTAGSAAGGDRRCNVEGIRQTASAAAIAVAGRDGHAFAGTGPRSRTRPRVWLHVLNLDDRRNAVDMLQRRYVAWRGKHPLPAPGSARTAPAYQPLDVPSGSRHAEPVVLTQRQALLALAPRFVLAVSAALVLGAGAWWLLARIPRGRG